MGAAFVEEPLRVGTRTYKRQKGEGFFLRREAEGGPGGEGDHSLAQAGEPIPLEADSSVACIVFSVLRQLMFSLMLLRTS